MLLLMSYFASACWTVQPTAEVLPLKKQKASKRIHCAYTEYKCGTDTLKPIRAPTRTRPIDGSPVCPDTFSVKQIYFRLLFGSKN